MPATPVAVLAAIVVTSILFIGSRELGGS